MTASVHPRCHGVVALVLLLAILWIARGMPVRSASGVDLLAMKLEWTVAWIGLHAQSPMTPLGAEMATSIDPRLQTSLGRQAANWLARNGQIRERLRWAERLSRHDQRHLPLLARAISAAVASNDCAVLQAAANAAKALPGQERAKLVRKLAKRHTSRCAM
jgi:hypothetical protein